LVGSSKTLQLDSSFLTLCSFAERTDFFLQHLISNACMLTLIRFGLFPVRSPLLGESLPCFLFLEVLRWFTSLRSPSHTYEFSVESPGSLPVGLPHSDICGSKPARDSPQLFAACHVLLRLWLPRHPPYALSSLTINLYES
jgi:hypothetical protein